MVPYRLVYSIHDPTEVAIRKMIDATSQRMIMINSQGGEGAQGGGLNPALKRHLELEIKTLLQNVPRDADEL